MNDDFNTNQLIRLSTLAEKTGPSVHCIRTYVDQKLIEVSDRTKGGLLLFNKTAVERLQFIKTARDAGVPLAKIICLLAASDNGNTDETNSSVTELNQYIVDIRSKVTEFEQSLLKYERLDNWVMR